MTSFEFLAILLAQLGMYYSLITRFIDGWDANIKKARNEIEAYKKELLIIKNNRGLTSEDEKKLKDLNKTIEKQEKSWKTWFSLPVYAICGIVIIATLIMTFSPWIDFSFPFSEYIPNVVVGANLILLICIIVRLYKIQENYVKNNENYSSILKNEKDVNNKIKQKNDFSDDNPF